LCLTVHQDYSLHDLVEMCRGRTKCFPKWFFIMYRKRPEKDLRKTLKQLGVGQADLIFIHLNLKGGAEVLKDSMGLKVLGTNARSLYSEKN